MSNELVKQIRSMLRDEFNPVHTRLDGIDNRPDKIDSHFDKINNRLDQSRLNGIEHNLKTLKSEQKQTEDNINAILEEFTKNITEHYDSKLSVLNKRLFTVESHIERLMK
jgi:predicted  nucleic acid-binding Zn-ribbon protein